MTAYSTAKMDYYDVLGIPATASAIEIKRAYRVLAVRYHPDKNPGDAGAEENFKQVAEAYTTLSDADQRRAYDQGIKYSRKNSDPTENSATENVYYDEDFYRQQAEEEARQWAEFWQEMRQRADKLLRKVDPSRFILPSRDDICAMKFKQIKPEDITRYTAKIINLDGELLEKELRLPKETGEMFASHELLCAGFRIRTIIQKRPDLATHCVRAAFEFLLQDIPAFLIPHILRVEKSNQGFTGFKSFFGMHAAGPVIKVEDFEWFTRQVSRLSPVVHKKIVENCAYEIRQILSVRPDLAAHVKKAEFFGAPPGPDNAHS